MLIGQIALQFVSILGEISHLVPQFLEPLLYGLLHGIAAVGERCGSHTRLVKGGDRVLGARKGYDAACTMRQRKSAEVLSPLVRRTERQGKRTLLVLLSQVLQKLPTHLRLPLTAVD